MSLSCFVIRFGLCTNFAIKGRQELSTVSMSTTAVIGAAGPTGLECVKRLLETGQPVVAVVRNPDKYKDTFPNDKNLQVKAGDVTDRQSLETVFEKTNAKRVIFAASGKNYFSAKDVDEQVKSSCHCLRVAQCVSA